MYSKQSNFKPPGKNFGGGLTNTKKFSEGAQAPKAPPSYAYAPPLATPLV